MTSSLFASSSRVAGLGYIGAYIDDDTNVMVFPGLLSKYRNRVNVEMESANSKGSANANYYFEDIGLDLGLFLEKPVNIVGEYSDFLGIDKPFRYSRLYLQKGIFGAYFGMSSDHWQEDQLPNSGSVEEESARVISFGLGSSADIGIPIDIGFHFSWAGAKVKYEGDVQGIDDSNVRFIGRI